jgi:protein TonB
MLAYAANRTVIGKESSPHGLLIVIAAHIALIAVVMSAKMDLPGRFHPGAIRVTLIPIPKAPPPNHLEQPRHHPLTSIPISDPLPNVPLPHPDPIPVDPRPTVDPGSIAGGGSAAIPQFPINLIPPPVHHDPRLLTPASELRPPYPQSKLLSEEEATLRLKLTISDSGRVIAVDPVGAADREFLDAARRYLIAHWRYQPASEDGRAVASSTVITLRFQLDG